jgi:hypothetical protein
MSPPDMPHLDVIPPGAPRLPADLAKLRERFLADYPHEARRAAMLALVPPALRHLLSLRLELDRADALPRRYRNLADAEHSAPIGIRDAVDQLVARYVEAARSGRAAEAAAMLPALRRYFTDPQIVELALTLAFSQALATFDSLLGQPPG